MHTTKIIKGFIQPNDSLEQFSCTATTDCAQKVRLLLRNRLDMNTKQTSKHSTKRPYWSRYKKIELSKRCYVSVAKRFSCSDVTPLESVHFQGKQALLQQKAAGLRRKLDLPLHVIRSQNSLLGHCSTAASTRWLRDELHDCICIYLHYMKKVNSVVIMT